MNAPVLSVKNLSTSIELDHHFATVVEKVSFDLHRGKTLAIVGESGCGKTMTALSIMRILPYPPKSMVSGEVLYQNKNLVTLCEQEMRKIRGGRIAMIFQDPTAALNPVYPIGNQLIETAELHLGLFGDDAIEHSIKALTEVGIPHPAERFLDYPHQISGGMRQRVMIAMALMCEPDILIADEPTTALDVTIQAQVLDLMRELQQRRGMAILLITHDLGVVAEIADDVIVMYSAQVVERGQVVDIFDKKSHPYTMGLFASRTDIDTPRGTLKPIKGSVPAAGKLPPGCHFHPRCPYAMERCRHGNVPVFQLLDGDGHEARCWLYDKSAESALQLAKELQ